MSSIVDQRCIRATPAYRRNHLAVRGAVQGVGFRPFVYRLATDLQLNGHVCNTPGGVIIEIEGPSANVEAFNTRLTADKPPLSIIDDCTIRTLPLQNTAGFTIVDSIENGRCQALVLPDIATCIDCLRDIFDPCNRRFMYPLTNCTHCGPRYSIIQRLPYDRSKTTMSQFEMCLDCQREYDDPRDRRFHAQPNACPRCGPQLALWDAGGKVLCQRQDALDTTVRALNDGLIVAVKGLGGFHLMVDPRQDRTVDELRRRKHRDEKPLALMYPTIDHVALDCVTPQAAADTLRSPAAPIVLLERLPGRDEISSLVAPGYPELGVMLPYTPLHHLLMHALDRPMVATSGNLSDEPMCFDEHDALDRLRDIADVFLVHDRPIHRHVDDSVVRLVHGSPVVLRRARGYAPLPVASVPTDHPAVLAVGGHLKNTIALATERRVFISQHIGDLETVPAQDAFEHTAVALAELYDTAPEIIACDEHPDYVSTHYARSHGSHVVAVQHHHAHIAACMAEHGLHDAVCGIAWDGTGYGSDGTVWGGEFMACTRRDYRRTGHLRQFGLPGGDRAAVEPRRCAVGVLYEIFGTQVAHMDHLPCVWSFTAQQRTTLLTALHRGINAPRTSSMGRLFDAIAALIGLQQTTAFEGQAAMRLQYCAADSSDQRIYSAPVLEPSGTQHPAIIDWEPMIRGILSDIAHGACRADVAARFHNTLIGIVVLMAQRSGLQDVVLSGGCFQNTLLLGGAIDALVREGFRVHWPQRVPAGDGGIALGQATVALARLAAAPPLEDTPCASPFPARS